MHRRKFNHATVSALGLRLLTAYCHAYASSLNEIKKIRP